jgi:hypothetical protein
MERAQVVQSTFILLKEDMFVSRKPVKSLNISIWKDSVHSVSPILTKMKTTTPDALLKNAKNIPTFLRMVMNACKILVILPSS